MAERKPGEIRETVPTRRMWSAPETSCFLASRVGFGSGIKKDLKFFMDVPCIRLRL